MFGLEAIDLARIQFAFTVSFHIIFPAIDRRDRGDSRRLAAMRRRAP